MKPCCVIDASYALSWFFPEEEGEKSRDKLLRRLETESAVVPGLWFLETANALLKQTRQKRISPAEALAIKTNLQQLRLVCDPAPVAELADSIFYLAQQYTLSAYDANYLELAIRLQIPLATLDDALKQAALKCGLSVF